MRLLLLIFALSAPLAAESLWNAETLADGNLYADATARRRGDILTVVVGETTSISDNETTENKRDNHAAVTIDMLPTTARVKQTAGADTSTTLPGFGATSSKEFKGDGKVTIDHTVRSSIAVQVVDVLDNGALVVRGSREVLVNLDRKTIQITGIIRPSDIKSDNTVTSDKIYDMQVSIVGEGPLTRTQQEGWLGRLIDTVWPF